VACRRRLGHSPVGRNHSHPLCQLQFFSSPDDVSSESPVLLRGERRSRRTPTAFLLDQLDATRRLTRAQTSFSDWCAGDGFNFPSVRAVRKPAPLSTTVVWALRYFDVYASLLLNASNIQDVALLTPHPSDRNTIGWLGPPTTTCLA
jgi:hypothetical protein